MTKSMRAAFDARSMSPYLPKTLSTSKPHPRSTLGALFGRLVQSRFLKFAGVGFSGVFVNLTVLYLCVERFGLSDILGSAVAIELSILWNFVLNNALTFRDRNAAAQAGFLARMVRYNVVSLVGLAIQLGAFYLLNRGYMSLRHLNGPGMFRYVSQCIGIVVAMGWNYFSNFRWTWNQRVLEPSIASISPPVRPDGDAARPR
jgi:putative flippase GtrA